MRIVGCMPCRNEERVLGLSARVALMWCDALVLFDHASTDRTTDIITEICTEHPGRVYRYREPSPCWDEMPHRQKMLQLAREAGATHIAIVDADEVVTGNIIHRVTAKILSCPYGNILQIPGYNLRGSLGGYHSNGIWSNRWFSVAFWDDPRWGWTGDKFHQREPRGMPIKFYQPIAQGAGGVMHLWGASDRNLAAKHAWYKITERLRWPNKEIAKIDHMYSLWRSPGNVGPKEPSPWTYARVPEEWWAPYGHLMHHLNLDAEPWQEAACRGAVAQYGADYFKGLDLFGVA